MKRHPGINRLQQSLATHERPHGTRARHTQGCRCLPCRAVVARLVAKRKASILAGTHQFNGIVSAARARTHLNKLSRKGVGLRTVRDVTGIHKRKLSDVRAGRLKNVRAETVRRILEVTPAALADGAQIPADKTRSLIRKLKRQGFTNAELALRLGLSPRTRIVKSARVSARRAMQIEKLFNLIMACDDEQSEREKAA